MEEINELIKKRIQSSVEFEMGYLEEHIIRAMGFIGTSTILLEDEEALEINRLLKQIAPLVKQFKGKKVV
jgi:hypothetical protein